MIVAVELGEVRSATLATLMTRAKWVAGMGVGVVGGGGTGVGGMVAGGIVPAIVGCGVDSA
ncbi:MAG: hypothetical protein M3P18_15435 [Actinomycetota bacterium]|nr:hypothetical protein [Actinomycetota bacterium]